MQTVRYLGEIENNSKQPSCFVDISFSSLDENGNPVDSGQGLVQSTVNGFTLTNIGGQEIHSCLLPGQFSSFDTGELSLDAPFDHFEFEVCSQRNGLCQTFPQARAPSVSLSLVNDSVDVSSQGNRTITGQILYEQNSRSDPDLTAHDVRIHFTVLDAEGKVIGTVLSPVLPSTSCNTNPASPPTNCLKVGGLTEPFTLDTLTPASETCDQLDACYYFRINHAEPPDPATQ